MAGNAVDNLRTRWEQVSEREQRLLMVLGITFVVVIAAYIGLQINKRLDSLESDNKKMRKALAALNVYRMSDGSQSTPNVPIPETPVKLQTYLANIADEIGIKIPNFNQLSPVTKDEFTETSIRIEIRDLSMQELSDFLQKVESGSQVVVIKALNIKQNFRNREKVDVRMDVATYSQKETAGEDQEDG